MCRTGLGVGVPFREKSVIDELCGTASKILWCRRGWRTDIFSPVVPIQKNIDTPMVTHTPIETVLFSPT